MRTPLASSGNTARNGQKFPATLNYLRAIADEVNDRPGAILGFRKPKEVFADLLLQESELPSA